MCVVSNKYNMPITQQCSRSHRWGILHIYAPAVVDVRLSAHEAHTERFWTNTNLVQWAVGVAIAGITITIW